MRLPIERIKESRERIGAAQLLSLLLFAYAIVVFRLPSSFDLYFFCFLVAIICFMLLLCFTVLIYINYLSNDYNKSLLFFLYTLFVSALCLFLVVATGNAASPVRALMLIPILIISTSQGEQWGLFASIVFGGYLIISPLLLPGGLENQLFESNFVLAAILLIVGWLVGGIIDTERAAGIKISSSEERFRTLFDNAPSGISIGRGDNIIFVNQAYLRMFGLDEQDGLDAAHDQFAQQCREIAGRADVRQEGQRLANTTEITGQRKDGAQIYLTVESAKIVLSDGPATVWFFSDITERKKYEQEFIRLDRLNIAGEIAAGIAHEIRNPMTIVRGYLQLLQNKEDFTLYRKRFDVMIQEIDRANEIITEFLSVVRDAAIEFKQQNLNDIIGAILPLIMADAMKTGKGVVLEAAEIPDASFDEKQIRQLILNLARNGLDAMPNEGILTIKTCRTDDEVILIVQDQGTGIAPDVLEKLGTPFFTTKEKGTGLGLATCFRIAERHHAKIQIETGAAGTAFLVRFTGDKYNFHQRKEPAIEI